jgi:hypothetical protein
MWYARSRSTRGRAHAAHAALLLPPPGVRGVRGESVLCSMAQLLWTKGGAMQ